MLTAENVKCILKSTQWNSLFFQLHSSLYFRYFWHPRRSTNKFVWRKCFRRVRNFFSNNYCNAVWNICSVLWDLSCCLIFNVHEHVHAEVTYMKNWLLALWSCSLYNPWWFNFFLGLKFWTPAYFNFSLSCIHFLSTEQKLQRQQNKNYQAAGFASNSARLFGCFSCQFQIQPCKLYCLPLRSCHPLRSLYWCLFLFFNYWKNTLFKFKYLHCICYQNVRKNLSFF